MGGRTDISSYLTPAIVVTVLAMLCCFPAGVVGLVAIVYASQVNTKIAASDTLGAMAASKNAKMWTMIAGALLAVGFILMALYIVGVLLLAATSAA